MKNSLDYTGRKYHLDCLGTSFGPSSANLGDTKASALGGEIFGLGAIIFGGVGAGFRGGYVFDAAVSGEPKIKYTGAVLEPMVFVGHPRVMLYASPGIVIGHVTPVGASTVLDERIRTKAFRPVLGVHVVAIRFNERVSYRLFAEVPYLITGTTEHGRYTSTSLLLGSIFTF